MSKDNMLLGFARGKVGDLVFYRRNGEQVTRARNAAPANPRTIRQSVQRSILKTVSSAYSLFSPIADHSFEGIDGKTPNQSEFTRRNIAMLREIIDASGIVLSDTSVLSSELANFATKQALFPVMNPYILSYGTLPQMLYAWISGNPLLFHTGNFSVSDTTYADVISALGAQRGDQLTFIWTRGNDEDSTMAGCMTGLEYARVILEPASGDMGTWFFNENQEADIITIADPNPRNEGFVQFDLESQGLSFKPYGGVGQPEAERVVTGAAVILSRKVGSTWKRSSQRLSIRPNLSNWDVWYLGDAVASYMDPPSSSNLYLNQAVDG